MTHAGTHKNDVETSHKLPTKKVIYSKSVPVCNYAIACSSEFSCAFITISRHRKRDRTSVRVDVITPISDKTQGSRDHKSDEFPICLDLL